MPLVFGPETTRIQLAIPQVFNPRHQLNPLKVFADRRFDGINGSDRTTETHSTEKKVNSTGSRLFVPFLDPIDGVLCLSADATAAEIDARAASHKLRFPLLIDRSATLREQVDATGFAPAASRFGPYCDNIVGMNWKLPNGNIVRIGERVVKTTTGYDLFRFLLSSGQRFGQPVDYVLRLRPDCGITSVYRLSGSVGAVSSAIPHLLKNCWMHWFDAIDMLAGSGECQLRIVVNCPADECPLVESFGSSFATDNSLTFTVEQGVPFPTDGCPDFVFKTLPENIVKLAHTVSQTGGIRCVALCYNGVLHGYVDDRTTTVERVSGLVRDNAEKLQAVGGDWHSRHLHAAIPSLLEAGWISTFLQESNIS